MIGPTPYVIDFVLVNEEMQLYCLCQSFEHSLLRERLLDEVFVMFRIIKVEVGLSAKAES